MKKDRYIFQKKSGITLLLSVLILSAVLTISLSISNILLTEIKVSGDLLRTEPSYYAAHAVTEEAIFKIKRKLCEVTAQNPTPNCSSFYSTSVGTVSTNQPAAPVESIISDPVQQDKVLVSSNTLANTSNVYLLNDPTNLTGPGNYGKLTLTLLDTNLPSGNLMEAYLCQYDPNDGGAPDRCTILTSDLSHYPGAWPRNFSKTSNTVSWVLDSSLQQELRLVNKHTSTLYVQISTFAANGTTPKGIPYFAETSVDINASQGGVNRKVRVKIPNN